MNGAPAPSLLTAIYNHDGALARVKARDFRKRCFGIADPPPIRVPAVEERSHFPSECIIVADDQDRQAVELEVRLGRPMLDPKGQRHDKPAGRDRPALDAELAADQCHEPSCDAYRKRLVLPSRRRQALLG